MYSSKNDFIFKGITFTFTKYKISYDNKYFENLHQLIHSIIAIAVILITVFFNEFSF
jgi:hypothetical protein